MMQVQLDREAFSRATDRSLTEVEKQEIQSIQERSYQWTFIGSGITHAKFVATFTQVSSGAQGRLTEVAQKYSQ